MQASWLLFITVLGIMLFVHQVHNLFFKQRKVGLVILYALGIGIFPLALHLGMTQIHLYIANIPLGMLLIAMLGGAVFPLIFWLYGQLYLHSILLNISLVNFWLIGAISAAIGVTVFVGLAFLWRRLPWERTRITRILIFIYALSILTWFLTREPIAVSTNLNFVWPKELLVLIIPLVAGFFMRSKKIKS